MHGEKRPERHLGVTGRTVISYGRTTEYADISACGVRGYKIVRLPQDLRRSFGHHHPAARSEDDSFHDDYHDLSMSTNPRYTLP